MCSRILKANFGTDNFEKIWVNFFLTFANNLRRKGFENFEEIFMYLKFWKNFKGIKKQSWSAKFWVNFSYILETVWGNNESEILSKFTHVKKFWEDITETGRKF